MQRTQRWIPQPQLEHYVDSFTFEVTEGADDYNVIIRGFSLTKKGSLWTCRLELGIDPEDDNAHLIAGQCLNVLVTDFFRDRPNTEARAYFVAGGGLYEQLGLF